MTQFKFCAHNKSNEVLPAALYYSYSYNEITYESFFISYPLLSLGKKNRNKVTMFEPSTNKLQRWGADQSERFIRMWHMGNKIRQYESKKNIANVVCLNSFIKHKKK